MDNIIIIIIIISYDNRAEGDILMDAPITNNWQELIKAAQDRKKWALGVRSIKDLIYVAALKKKPKTKGKRKSNNKGKEMKKKSRPKYKMVGTGLDAILVPCVYSDESEEEEDNGSDDEDNDSKPATALAPIRKVIICRDGFRMSVQASKDHACTPRDDLGPYAAVEVGFPSEIEPLLMPFSDTPNIYTSIVPDIYANVPADTIRAVIQYHAGLRHDSAQLPPLVDYSEVPPTPPPSPPPAALHEGSPTSMIHLGDPPPPPPPLPASTGQLSPPTTLTHCDLSQI